MTRVRDRFLTSDETSAAFVAYRAGAFTSDAGPVARSTSPTVFPAIPPDAVEYFGGSKSDAVVRILDEKPATPPVVPPQTAPAMEADGEEEYFPGSKSLIGVPRKPKPVTPLPPPTPQVPPEAAPTKPVPPTGQRAPEPGV